MADDRLTKRDAFLAAVNAGPVVMGIVNMTPDSFSDGGLHAAPEAALNGAVRMASEGAAIVDVGAESTRPGATPLSASEELARLDPALSQICAAVDVAVSVDTYKADVARFAAQSGAAVINDVWGLHHDPQMAHVVAETGSALIAMHNRTDVDPYLDIISDINTFFEHSLTLAAKAGIPDTHIILDPGIGFGKTLEQNYRILNQLADLRKFGRPILLGLSRKRMIGEVTGAAPADRMAGTVAANVIGLRNGANILRVHDVAEHVNAVKIFNAAEQFQ